MMRVSSKSRPRVMGCSARIRCTDGGVRSCRRGRRGGLSATPLVPELALSFRPAGPVHHPSPSTPLMSCRTPLGGEATHQRISHKTNRAHLHTPRISPVSLPVFPGSPACKAEMQRTSHRHTGAQADKLRVALEVYFTVPKPHHSTRSASYPIFPARRVLIKIARPRVPHCAPRAPGAGSRGVGRGNQPSVAPRCQ